MTESRPRALHLELDAYPDDAVRRLRAAMDLTDGSSLRSDRIAAALAESAHEILFVRLGVRIDAKVVDAAPSLRLVVTPTTGLDHLDLGSLRSAGIRVMSLRDARPAIESVHATAEHTFALLLACVRNLTAAHRDVVEGHWRRQRFLGTELSSRTIGIVGHGRLGRRVAGYAQAFGMEVLVHDTAASSLTDLPVGVTATDADSLLRASDVISLHLPLAADTRGWLDARRIGLLKDGAIVVNTARGELVDEAALAQALREGRLGGVAVDVLADDANWGESLGESPLLPQHLLGANLVVTPHIGGWARDAVARTRRLVTDMVLEGL